MKVTIRTFLLSLIFISQTLYAIEVERLYQAEVIANSENEQDKNIAIKQALSIVLSRILVGDNALNNQTVKSVLSNAIHYVNEFQYSLITNDKNDNARLMRVVFDEKLLIDVFRQSELGFWNEIRSRTLVWLIVEKDGEQQFFDATLMPEVDAAMNKAARQKALPILYPIQDLSEQRILTISDVLSAYSDHLLDVSQRYDVTSTLAGKIVYKDNCWQAEWTLYFDERIEQWKSQCGLINEVALNGFQGVYENLSTYYAVKPSSKIINSVVLKVSNIKGKLELAKVINYLDSLSMVKTVTRVLDEPGYTIYRIFYQGARSALSRVLAKDHVIRAEDYTKQNADIVKYKLMAEIF